MLLETLGEGTYYQETADLQNNSRGRRFRDCSINAFQLGRHVPQGLKPAFCQAMNGTTEAVPYPKPIYETSFCY